MPLHLAINGSLGTGNINGDTGDFSKLFKWTHQSDNEEWYSRITNESDWVTLLVLVLCMRVVLVSVNSDQISKEKVPYLLRSWQRPTSLCSLKLKKLAQTCLKASFITTCQAKSSWPVYVGRLPVMTYMGSLGSNWVPFLGFRYSDFTSWGVWKSREICHLGIIPFFWF